MLNAIEAPTKPKRRGPDRRTVVIPTEVLDQLHYAAFVREISVNELVRRIVEAVADDDIVDAVLDDREQLT